MFLIGAGLTNRCPRYYRGKRCDIYVIDTEISKKAREGRKRIISLVAFFCIGNDISMSMSIISAVKLMFSSKWHNEAARWNL